MTKIELASELQAAVEKIDSLAEQLEHLLTAVNTYLDDPTWENRVRLVEVLGGSACRT